MTSVESDDPRAIASVAAIPAKARKPAAVRAYRADIDGLRAVAVISVVLFHLGSTIVKGGYVGVDVFFVISGYLITGILQNEIDARNFSILRFYDRRIRRIFPALFAVLIFCMLAAPFVLLPPEISDVAKSTIATSLFSSNMYFMHVIDYFAAGAESNPLLHTWSLAVEEQFYIFFPLLLFLLNKVSRAWLAYILSGLALLSLLLSTFLLPNHQVASFYLAPSRSWELLIGSLLALKLCPQIESKAIREGAAAIGLVMILAACSLFYRNMPFPGPRALVPCLGAAFIIHAGSAGPTWVGRILSLRPVVFIGLISFSLYLWHWPLIVFSHLLLPHAPGVAENVVIFAVSCAIATLSWRYIERPFRQKRIAVTPWTLRWAAFATQAVILTVALAFVVSNGAARLFPSRAVQLANYLHYDDRPDYRRGVCFLDSHASPLSDFDDDLCLKLASDAPNILLIGDSHAAHLWKGMANAFPGANILQITASGCKPVFGGHGNPTCEALMQRGLNMARSNPHIAAVFLSARWEKSDIDSLVATVDKLAGGAAPVYVSGPIVEYRQSLPRILALADMKGDDRALISERLAEQGETDVALASALVGHRAIYLSPYEALCKDNTQPCRALASDGSPLQWDYGHLTATGASDLMKRLRENGRIAELVRK